MHLQMQASNLGVVFGPNLFGMQDALDMNAVLRKNAVTTSLIERAPSLFPVRVAISTPAFVFPFAVR
jgi:hypothetical protein